MFLRLILICALVLNWLAISFPRTAQAAGTPLKFIKQAMYSASTHQNLWPHDGAYYYSFRTSDGVKVNVVAVDVNSGKWQLKPVVNPRLGSVSGAAQRSGATVAVNGGYFNEHTGAGVSYVVIDGNAVVNTRSTLDLNRHDLRPYRNAIANRSEIRILEDASGKQTVEIAPHDAPVTEGFKLVHSLQGGPQLLPVLTVREEAFIRRDANGRLIDVIASTSRAARTALGITSDGSVVIVAVEGPEQGGNSPGVTLVGLARIMKQLGCVRAVNLDGGHSTTMFVRFASNGKGNGTTPQGSVVCGTRPQRPVKSVLVVVPVKR